MLDVRSYIFEVVFMPQHDSRGKTNGSVVGLAPSVSSMHVRYKWESSRHHFLYLCATGIHELTGSRTRRLAGVPIIEAAGTVALG